jgi:hypothetical protein
LLPGVALLALASLGAQAQTTLVFRDAKQPLSVRVNDLIKQLSLEEKAQQMLRAWASRPTAGGTRPCTA